MVLDYLLIALNAGCAWAGFIIAFAAADEPGGPNHNYHKAVRSMALAITVIATASMALNISEVIACLP